MTTNNESSALQTFASLLLPLAFSACVQAKKPAVSPAAPTQDDILSVSPALARYTQDLLMRDLWRRPDLSTRDRSIVTLAALISRGQTVELSRHLDLALQHGLEPSEISELVTHLGFYAGWENAIAAVPFVKGAFERHGVNPDQLPPASGDLLPLDQTAESERAARVEENFGVVTPGVVQFTSEVLFRELWLRPGLAPRDRSLVTVSALVATGQAAQLPYHLNRAMDAGLTKAQASEVFTQLAFYAGWPSVFSALPVAKEVFSKRGSP